MKFSLYEEVVFKSVSGIVAKKVYILNYKLTTSKLSDREDCVGYTRVVDFSALFTVVSVLTS